MKAALVIMAAGLGSRYGGNKQVDGVGPDGEILMEYSICPAFIPSRPSGRSPLERSTLFYAPGAM